MTALLDRIGAYEPVSQDVFSWNVLDRTRLGGTVSSVAGNTTATATFEITEFAYDGDNLGYLIVGDVIRLQSGALGKVTAVAVSTIAANKQKVTVVRPDGSAWTAAALADAMVFGHVFTSFGEASSAPEGRLFLPTEEYNYTTILRRSFSISGSEFTNKIYLGDGKSWYWEVEDIHQKEFARDREGLIMFGERASNGNAKMTRGILDYVIADGVNNGYATAAGVTEADIRDHIKSLLIEGSSNELTVLCGADFLADVQVALRDYALNGAISYGKFGANTAGLDFHTYKFLGKTIHFVYYELFEDAAMVPYAANGSASLINFSNFSLWLDLGSDSTGKSLITLKYKELDGQSRKFIYGYVPGMMNPKGANGGEIPNGDDKFSIHMLSEIGVEFRLANRSGILRATS